MPNIGLKFLSQFFPSCQKFIPSFGKIQVLVVKLTNYTQAIGEYIFHYNLPVGGEQIEKINEFGKKLIKNIAE